MERAAFRFRHWMAKAGLLARHADSDDGRVTQHRIDTTRPANVAIESDCDLHFRFVFRASAAANFAFRRRRFGNAFRLRSVTKNCLPRRMGIAYIAIHFAAFAVCTDRRSRRVRIAGSTRQAMKTKRSLNRRAGGIQHTRIAMTETAS
ncbi:hypothetical protein [Burkholderia ambifaria]|uniref:hypothetical protein n=1 Tax=Burkholderia ambifaria TaxID=152480 RepID=UPI0018E0A1C1|nr:hypothetical protein [Burkholderia ambifaria]